MIGALCWFELEGIPMRGLIVQDGAEYNADTWVVKLDKPILCSGGCSHTHAAPPKQDTVLES